MGGGARQATARKEQPRPSDFTFFLSDLISYLNQNFNKAVGFCTVKHKALGIFCKQEVSISITAFIK